MNIEIFDSAINFQEKKVKIVMCKMFKACAIIQCKGLLDGIGFIFILCQKMRLCFFIFLKQIAVLNIITFLMKWFNSFSSAPSSAFCLDGRKIFSMEIGISL